MTIVDEVHGYGWDISLSEEGFVKANGSKAMLGELRLKDKPSRPNFIEIAFDSAIYSIGDWINRQYVDDEKNAKS